MVCVVLSRQALARCRRRERGGRNVESEATRDCSIPPTDTAKCDLGAVALALVRDINTARCYISLIIAARPAHDKDRPRCAARYGAAFLQQSRQAHMYISTRTLFLFKLVAAPTLGEGCTCCLDSSPPIHPQTCSLSARPCFIISSPSHSNPRITTFSLFPW